MSIRLTCKYGIRRRRVNAPGGGHVVDAALAQRLGGHLVRGGVEGTGTLESLTPDGDAIIARYLAPQEILRFVVVKGPITIDGASLTVIDKTADTPAVSLVEYTQQQTNLTRRKPGDRINLESDIIARYVEELLQERSETT